MDAELGGVGRRGHSIHPVGMSVQCCIRAGFAVVPLTGIGIAEMFALATFKLIVTVGVACISVTKVCEVLDLESQFWRTRRCR